MNTAIHYTNHNHPRIVHGSVVGLMERMIAELFPCAIEDNDPTASSSRFGTGQDPTTAAPPLPLFEEFLRHICRRTRTPLTCMCLALLYLTRLRANHPRSRGSPGSSYRLALSSLCVATKYLYDDAYHTCSWVQVSMGLFSQREVNQMEMEFMYFLNYQLGVTPTEWNQWIATLEAKLVSRWQEKGKADVIYSFGLFLSYECCEPDSQKTVRDIAWSDSGKNLLIMLHNAIHPSGTTDFSKCSPSADSAVSDSTCLPTPDPSSWFRIRSPVPPGCASIAAGMAHSKGMPLVPAINTNISGGLASAPITSSATTITPTAMHFQDNAMMSDDRCSVHSLRPVRSTFTVNTATARHSFIDCSKSNPSPCNLKQATRESTANNSLQQQQHPSGTTSFSTYHNSAYSVSGCTPSSFSNIPVISYNSEVKVANSNNRASSRYSSAPQAVNFRHLSEAKVHDWREQNYTEPRMPSTGSEYVAQNGAYNNAKQQYPQSVTLDSSPYTSYLAEETSSRSLRRKRSGEPHDGSSTAVPIPAAHTRFDQRSSNNSGAWGRASGAVVASAMSGQPLSGEPPSATNTGGGLVASSGIRYYSNGGIGNAPCAAASAKSSTSSLRMGSRHQSWRNSYKVSSGAASAFAQKLRSFAAFNWSSSGNGNSHGGGHEPSGGSSSNNGISANDWIALTTKEQGPCCSDEGDSASYMSGSNDIASSVAARNSISAAPYNSWVAVGDGKRNSYCPFQLPSATNGYSSTNRNSCHYPHVSAQHLHPLPPPPTSAAHVNRRFTDMTGQQQRVALANVWSTLEGISSPSYDFDVDMNKYVSTKL